jgi:3-keto-disaccharide hydrolase
MIHPGETALKKNFAFPQGPINHPPMNRYFLTALVGISIAAQAVAAESEAGFKVIFDGKTFDGWKIGDADAKSWSIEDGAFVARGPRSHVYYVGDEQPFKDFELKVDVMTEPGSNGGIYFHTKYQESSWPRNGFECQVNVSQTDWIKTGSLYGLVNMALTPAQDNKWWTQHIIVKGNQVTVKIDGKTVLEYNEPPGAQAGKDFTRKLDQGTFAFQAHDPKSVIRYKNVRVKRL